MHRNDSETSVGFRVFCSSVADRNKNASATTAERLARFRNTFQNPSVADLDFSLDGNEKPHRARPFTWARNRIIGHVFGVFLRDGFKVWFDLLELP